LKQITSSVHTRSIFLVFVAGCLVPLAGVLGIVATGFDILTGTGDSDKFYRPAYRLLETGVYGFAATEKSPYIPDLGILPVYPLIIAAVFKVFGLGNFIAVAFFQVVLQGMTTVAIALAARSFRISWMWPAAILAAFWPNLAYRPTTIMSETVFGFFLAWGICALLWVSKGRNILQLLALAGFCFGFAFMTRPTLLLFPLVVAPAIVYVLKRDVGVGLVKASFLSAIPFLIMFAFTAPQYIQSYKAYGEFKFTVQRGHNVLYYLYPCLSANWGCGQRDQNAITTAKKRIAEEYLNLPKENRAAHLYDTDHLKERIGKELIMDLPIATLVKGVVGSSLKSLMHNVSYEIMKRFQISPIYFGEMKSESFFGRAKEFVAAVAATPWMWVWAVFQIGLFASRGVQIASLLSLRDSPDRAKVVLLLSMIVAFMAVSVGFGSVRYRAASEPELILLTLIGWHSLKNVIVGRRFA
jgi:hypothetical protein